MAPHALWTRPIGHAPEVAMRVAAAAEEHGIYVHNALAAGEGDGFLFGDGPTPGVCWFGPRGNLVILGDAAVAADPDEVAAQVQVRGRPWRIAMGPAPIVDALRRRCVGAPLVHRNQVYYRGSAATANAAIAIAAVRPAERRDRDRLLQATLQLNAADLLIEPRRVDRRWLYDTIDERIAAGTTWVCGRPGAIDAKLDHGSVGPGGLVLEGVFTFPAARGRGVAAGLVAARLAAARAGVALHVGEDNVAARRAYERAGMKAAGRCRLLLLG